VWQDGAVTITPPDTEAQARTYTVTVYYQKCSACDEETPEFDSPDKVAAYVRKHWGYFSNKPGVYCPDCWSVMIRLQMAKPPKNATP
jgi:hypothetical protein